MIVLQDGFGNGLSDGFHSPESSGGAGLGSGLALFSDTLGGGYGMGARYGFRTPAGVGGGNGAAGRFSTLLRGHGNGFGDGRSAGFQYIGDPAAVTVHVPRLNRYPYYCTVNDQTRNLNSHV